MDSEALVYLANHRPTFALSRAQVALKLDPAYWFTHYVLASAYHDSGQTTRARDEAASALLAAKNALAIPSTELQRLQTLQRTG